MGNETAAPQQQQQYQSQQQQPYQQQQQPKPSQYQQQYNESASQYSDNVSSHGDIIDFGDKVLISYNFWKDNVDMLERSKQQQLGILLFSNLFKRQPACRNIFADSDISKQSLRLLDMFGWLLRSLIKEKNRMRTRTLKSLGERHVKYNIKMEFFEPMLDSLSDALQDYFGNNYNTQTRVALVSLFQSCCNEMMKHAGQKAPFIRTDMQQQGGNVYGGQSKSYHWLRSLEFCLADPFGFGSLEEYLNKNYGGQLIGFHKAFRIYRCCLNAAVRKDIAHEITKLFLAPQAQYGLNDSGDNRKKIYGIMQRCDELKLDYPIDLFDGTHTWVKFQISQSHWMKFKIMIQSTE